ncbi:MAG: HAMP domain-containing histidine kinase [Betaproteobacteria bacterium]|nr:HAMP domain-containing histidine kinase [Betaproteobacteria bacterium]
MRLPYPRSFSSLLLVGFALVTLPLLLGMGYTAYVQERLAAQTRSAIAITVQVTRTTRQLAEDISTLQRAAGQFYVLQDPQLRAGMRDAHEAVDHALQTLRVLPFGPSNSSRINTIGQRERALYLQLNDPANVGLRRFDSFATEFAALSRLADQLTVAGNAMVDSQVAALTRRAQTLRTVLLSQAAAAVLLSVLIAALFSWLLSRPVRQIDQAIRRLGAGDLQPQPRVQGPVDLVFLGQQLDWLRLRLRELDEQKLRFLRHVSHELKTPLASLREGVELLADGVGGKLTAQQREITQIMRGNARDLQQRIESLIGYSRAQRQLDPLVSGGVDLPALLDALVRRNDLALRAKRLRVQREGSAPLLLADRGKLDTLFENLLINAMRFSPVNGVIAITVRGATETVEVMVCDQGPGVAEEDRAHLFKPFFQGSRQPPAAATGSGLGLAIAREYAQLHGGDIELCQTQGDGGACFCVHLPLRPDLPAAQGKAHAVAAAANTDQSEGAGALEGDPESSSDWVSTQPSDDKG